MQVEQTLSWIVRLATRTFVATDLAVHSFNHPSSKREAAYLSELVWLDPDQPSSLLHSPLLIAHENTAQVNATHPPRLVNTVQWMTHTQLSKGSVHVEARLCGLLQQLSYARAGFGRCVHAPVM